MSEGGREREGRGRERGKGGREGEIERRKEGRMKR